MTFFKYVFFMAIIVISFIGCSARVTSPSPDIDRGLASGSGTSYSCQQASLFAMMPSMYFRNFLITVTFFSDGLMTLVEETREEKKPSNNGRFDSREKLYLIENSNYPISYVFSGSSRGLGENFAVGWYHVGGSSVGDKSTVFSGTLGVYYKDPSKATQSFNSTNGIVGYLTCRANKSGPIH